MQTEKLNLKKTKNMRDMGGIPTADGRKIKSRKVLRSGRMHKLPPKTVQTLGEMDIDNIIDLRTKREIMQKPSTILEGVTYHNIPLAASGQPYLSESRYMTKEVYAQSKRVKSDFGTPENYIIEMYKFIVFDPDSQKGLKAIFDLLIAEEKCIVFHCNSGTDRTGIVAMLLEAALGADREAIVADYMTSRRLQLRRRNWQRLGLVFAPIPISFKKLLFAQMLPKPQYITGVMDAIEEKYGSIANYLKDALGVSDKDIETLKQKYLE